MADAKTLWRLCRTPVLTWTALVILLAMTCALAYVPMGGTNIVVSLSIAAVKALLVGAIFMRLWEGTALNRLVASAGPIWLFIMFLLMGTDFFTR